MVTLSALHVYPIKSCGGINLPAASMGAFGLALDRSWMLIDRAGRFLTQREHPLMATVKTAIDDDVLNVRAPGMPALRVTLQLPADGATVPVTVWTDSVLALDGGEQAYQWFSSYFGADARLVRFDPTQERICSPRWTGETLARTQFADGFPLLVASEASLLDLNQRLQKKGAPALPMNRFRPNLVLSGLDAYEEDYIDTVTFGAPGQEVVIKLVKPCPRCPVPGIDQDTGAVDPQWPNEPLDTLATYRANQRIDGGLAFGQNAIVIQGQGHLLRVGQEARVELRF